MKRFGLQDLGPEKLQGCRLQGCRDLGSQVAGIGALLLKCEGFLVQAVQVLRLVSSATALS